MIANGDHERQRRLLDVRARHAPARSRACRAASRCTPTTRSNKLVDAPRSSSFSSPSPSTSAGSRPMLYWLDSRELAAAAWGLGVAHPPGHPLPSLLGRACALLPLGSIALRVGLASALARRGGGGADGAARRRWWRGARGCRRNRDARIDGLVGAAAGLTFGLSYAAAFQAVRPEVYALSALLVVTAAYELARYDETGDRRRLVHGRAGGRAGAVEPSSAGADVRGAGGARVRAARRMAPLGARAASSVAARRAGGVGLSAAARARAIRSSTGARRRRSARICLDRERARVPEGGGARRRSATSAASPRRWRRELQLVGALLALGGAYVLVRLGPRGGSALLLLGAALARRGDAGAGRLRSGATPTPTAISRRRWRCWPRSPARSSPRSRRPRSGPRVMRAVARRARRRRRAPAASLGCARVFARALLGHRRHARPLPRRARRRARVVVTSYFQTIFALWYLRGVEGRRPDVDLVHRHFLAYPGYRDEIARRVGDVSRERAIALVEYDLDLPDALVARSTTIAVADDDEPQTRRYAAWQAYLGADRACRLDPDARRAARSIARARAARRCRR